ncbi:MAG: protein phosphatase 2C domain-containing protein [Mycoplasmoidaceae bacterium]|nr:protein phosphatase 2C domain-containing protein [Mycoplasmoidaceae bacterium]
MMKKRIKFAIKSLKGRRKANQDALACAYNKANDFIAIVCDGVGSIQHSEHASQITVDTFCDEFIKTNKILNISE